MLANTLARAETVRPSKFLRPGALVAEYLLAKRVSGWRGSGRATAREY